VVKGQNFECLPSGLTTCTDSNLEGVLMPIINGLDPDLPALVRDAHSKFKESSNLPKQVQKDFPEL
jgi:hypothetical protein